jgi:hypothetical protein
MKISPSDDDAEPPLYHPNKRLHATHEVFGTKSAF